MAPIELAETDDVRLGGITVRPSLREVQGHDRREIVQPRVMAVLVALAQAEGRVVSRDELIARCWQGVVVGDDAINRVISKLRAIAADIGGGAFRVETVARVGYRLLTDQRTEPVAVGALATPPPTMARAPRSRAARRWLGGATIVAGALAGIAALSLRAPVPMAGPAPTNPVVSSQNLVARGLSAMFEGSPEQARQAITYLRQAAAIDRRNALAWGALAMAYVLQLPDVPVPDQPAAANRIREAAGRALAIDPTSGAGLAAMASLTPTFGDWTAKAALLRRSVALSPDGQPLLYQRIQFLIAVGRLREAMPLANRLAAESPLLPWVQSARAFLLAANDHPDAADRTADGALATWPRNRLAWFTRFELAAYYGQPEKAVAMVEDKTNWPIGTTPDELALAGAIARAMRSRAPGDIDAALAMLRRLAPTGQGYAEEAIRFAAAVNRPDDALAALRLLIGTPLAINPRGWAMPRIGLNNPAERNTAALFLTPSRLFEAPGFLSATQAIGLTAFWRMSTPPDFCAVGEAARRCTAAGLYPRPRSR